MPPKVANPKFTMVFNNSSSNNNNNKDKEKKKKRRSAFGAGRSAARLSSNSSSNNNGQRFASVGSGDVNESKSALKKDDGLRRPWTTINDDSAEPASESNTSSSKAVAANQGEQGRSKKVEAERRPWASVSSTIPVDTRSPEGSPNKTSKDEKHVQPRPWTAVASSKIPNDAHAIGPTDAVVSPNADLVDHHVVISDDDGDDDVDLNTLDTAEDLPGAHRVYPFATASMGGGGQSVMASQDGLLIGGGTVVSAPTTTTQVTTNNDEQAEIEIQTAEVFDEEAELSRRINERIRANVPTVIDGTNVQTVKEEPDGNTSSSSGHIDSKALIAEQKRRRRMFVLLIVGCILLVAGLGIVASSFIAARVDDGTDDTSGITTSGSGSSSGSTTTPTKSPTSSPTISNVEYLLSMLIEEEVSTEESLMNITSYQYQAVEWMVNEDMYGLDLLLNLRSNRGRDTEASVVDDYDADTLRQMIIERYVLTLLYYATDGSNWTLSQVNNRLDGRTADDHNPFVFMNPNASVCFIGGTPTSSSTNTATFWGTGNEIECNDLNTTIIGLSLSKSRL